MDAAIAPHLDLANHHADATEEDVRRLCANVLKYGFNAAFVNPCYIGLAREELRDLPAGKAGKAKVGTAISFPLGQDTLEMKIFAAREAIRLGADELDIAPNNARLTLDEMKTIVEAGRAARTSIVIKFILETGLLTDEHIQQGAVAIVESGADFIKICSGMGPRGASLEDVKLVREAVGEAPVKIKVAGGIDTIEEVRAFLSAGVHRIGTSKAVEIMEQMARI